MTLIKFPCKDDKSPGVSGWQTYQGAVNSAVVGYMIPEGLIVLDLDTYKGVTCSDVETALGCSLLWHEAELQKTRSGGHHYAFRVPHGCCFNKITTIHVCAHNASESGHPLAVAHPAESA